MNCEKDREAGAIATIGSFAWPPNLLSENNRCRNSQPPEQLGAVAVFACSETAAQIRGVALPVNCNAELGHEYANSLA